MALSASVHSLIKLQSLEKENFKLHQCDAIKNISENAVGEKSLGWLTNAGISVHGELCEHWDPAEEFEIAVRKLLLPHNMIAIPLTGLGVQSQSAVTPYGLVGLASSAPLSSSVISSALGQFSFSGVSFDFKKGGRHLCFVEEPRFPWQ